MIKRIVVNIALVAVVVFVLDFAIGRTLRHYYFKETSGLHFRTTYSLETTRADIVIFGSSRANHHYVPEVFEDSLKGSFYNTGRDGNGIFFQNALLKSVLKRYTPKIILLDYAGNFGKDVQAYDKISSLLPYYRTHDEIKKDIELKSSFERIKLLSEIYPFNSQVLTIAMGNLDMNRKRNPDDKGYVALHAEKPPEMEVYTTYRPYVPDPQKVKALREFVMRAKESGAKVVVTYSPMLLRYLRNQEVEVCREVCAAEKVPFWDFSQDSFYLKRRELFYDPVHLSHEGAILFSNTIVSKIKNTL